MNLKCFSNIVCEIVNHFFHKRVECFQWRDVKGSFTRKTFIIKGHQRTAAMGLHFGSLFKAAVTKIRDHCRLFKQTLFYEL